MGKIRLISNGKIVYADFDMPYDQQQELAKNEKRYMPSKDKGFFVSNATYPIARSVYGSLVRSGFNSSDFYAKSGISLNLNDANNIAVRKEIRAIAYLEEHTEEVDEYELKRKILESMYPDFVRTGELVNVAHIIENEHSEKINLSELKKVIESSKNTGCSDLINKGQEYADLLLLAYDNTILLQFIKDVYATLYLKQKDISIRVDKQYTLGKQL